MRGGVMDVKARKNSMKFDYNLNLDGLTNSEIAAWYMQTKRAIKDAASDDEQTKAKLEAIENTQAVKDHLQMQAAKNQIRRMKGF